MEIDVEGRTWTVERRDAGTLSPDVGAGYCELLFRPAQGQESEGVEMRWIPRPERLTPAVAGRLFLLAGERCWRDPRDGVLHRVLLEGGSWPGDEAPDGPDPRTAVRFVSDVASSTTVYDLDRPLGLASDADLARLLDRAGRVAVWPRRVASAGG